jgi:nucleoside 2-deoxyribosyltransferase
MKIYFAGPLFTLAKKRFNQDLADAITRQMPESEIILPQNDAKNFDPTEEDFFRKIFNSCIGSLNQCDIVLAILDGSDSDSGTCIEMGYAYATGKPIIGLRTDFRSLEENGVNLMVSNVCSSYVLETSIDDTSQLASKVINQIKAIVIL